MEQTFITIHNLTPDANILFVSDSIADILGYQPQEVQGRSCFDYFHPDEVPFARSVHSRGILLDKAAVLHYARVLSSDGRWVNCECCFTIVHDVLVACTSIYRRGERSERRASQAPQIRRIFSCSPRDPRYHMLEHLSPKFKMPPMEREPRAALIINRFTRSLPIMFATNAASSLLGIRPDQLVDKSFYDCIQENCHAEAVRCLESAKSNDSIAYLRFWYQDPRQDDGIGQEGDVDVEEDLIDGEGKGPSTDTSDSDGGARLDGHMDIDSDRDLQGNIKHESGASDSEDNTLDSLTYSGPSSTFASSSSSQTCPTSLTSHSGTIDRRRVSPMTNAPNRIRQRLPMPSIELEAVVSCTSDGLVVVLRRARPPIPAAHPPLLPLDFENGLFAAPWGQQPIRPHFPPEMLYTFRPPLMPQYMPLRDNIKAAGGPPLDQLMSSIRDVAVFAWAVVGINGNLATYSRGLPRGEAQPPDGLPVWDPNARSTSYLGPENQAAQRWARGDKAKGPVNPVLSLPASYHADVTPCYTHGSPQVENYTYLHNQQRADWSATPAQLYGGEFEVRYNRDARQLQPTSAYSRLPNEPRREAAPTYGGAHNSRGYPMTTQAPGSGDSHGGFRYMWQ